MEHQLLNKIEMKPTPLPTITPIWDRFVRTFHWTLVLCVMVNYFLISDGEVIHRWTGYLASALVCMRIVWGFIGSKHARFRDFTPSPSKVVHHVRAMFSGELERHSGHNPLGALMMFALMGTVIGLGVSGWMQTLDAFWGEEWLQAIHEFLANTLIALATLHALSAIVMGRIERTKLIKAMFTGEKETY